MALAFFVLLVLLLYPADILLLSRNIDISSILIKTVEDDSKIRQIMCLINNTDDYYDLSAIAKQLPVVIVDYKNATENRTLQLILMPMFINSRSTLIVLFSETELQPHDFALGGFLTKLVLPKQTPKILIVRKCTVSESYRKFLKFMWMNKFLDLTILEVIKQKSRNEHFSSKETDLVVHYFNPFTARFTKLRINSKISFEVFPDKLMNLYGYEMKVGYFHYPPYVSITRNESGHVLKLEGPDYQLVKILSKEMNFRVLEIISNKTSWDVTSCTMDKNTGLTRGLVYSQLNFVGVQSGRAINSCMEKMIRYIEHSFGKIYYSAVTPTLTDDATKFSVELRLSYLMAIVALLGITWLFPNIVHFDEQNWRIVDLIRIMLGMHAPPLPRQSAERVFFAFMLITCFLHSSVIFTAFTSINLQTESSTVINTLNYLYSTNFTPVIHSNVLQLFQVDEVKVADYVRRASRVANTDSECIQYLLNHRNVTCFMRSTQADLAITSAGKDNVSVLMHKVKEPLADLMISVKCEPGFPYETRFLKIFTRLQQTGIPYTWQEKYFSSVKETDTMIEALISESDASNLQCLQNILTILIFGFSSSIVVFVGEIAFHSFSNILRPRI